MLSLVIRWSVNLTATAAVEFAAHGYRVMELNGGWRWWSEERFDVET
jgi:hypothetical protein